MSGETFESQYGKKQRTMMSLMEMVCKVFVWGVTWTGNQDVLA